MNSITEVTKLERLGFKSDWPTKVVAHSRKTAAGFTLTIHEWCGYRPDGRYSLSARGVIIAWGHLNDIVRLAYRIARKTGGWK